jgi:hypothetical protein
MFSVFSVFFMFFISTVHTRKLKQQKLFSRLDTLIFRLTIHIEQPHHSSRSQEVNT